MPRELKVTHTWPWVWAGMFSNMAQPPVLCLLWASTILVLGFRVCENEAGPCVAWFYSSELGGSLSPIKMSALVAFCSINDFARTYSLEGQPLGFGIAQVRKVLWGQWGCKATSAAVRTTIEVAQKSCFSRWVFLWKSHVHKLRCLLYLACLLGCRPLGIQMVVEWCAHPIPCQCCFVRSTTEYLQWVLAFPAKFFELQTQGHFQGQLVSRWLALWAMRFAELATLVVVLLRAFGEVTEETSTHLQEDCAGVGNIACATRLFHLQAARRDVACLQNFSGCFRKLVCGRHVLLKLCGQASEKCTSMCNVTLGIY